jgi:hypothetical protein
MRRLPGSGAKGAWMNGLAVGTGRGAGGTVLAPGFNPSNRIKRTSFRHIAYNPYYVALQQLQDRKPPQSGDGRFTRISRFVAPNRLRAHCSAMGLSARAKELKNLLSLAVKLRQLANGTLPEPDQAIYRLAAEALEKRKERLAAKSKWKPIPPGDPRLYRPVDMRV